jgi:hypothetical protein
LHSNGSIRHNIPKAAIPEPSISTASMQQWRNCWERCFLWSTCRGPAVSREKESLQAGSQFRVARSW